MHTSAHTTGPTCTPAWAVIARIVPFSGSGSTKPWKDHRHAVSEKDANRRQLSLAQIRYHVDRAFRKGWEPNQQTPHNAAGPAQQRGCVLVRKFQPRAVLNCDARACYSRACRRFSAGASAPAQAQDLGCLEAPANLQDPRASALFRIISLCWPLQAFARGIHIEHARPACVIAALAPTTWSPSTRRWCQSGRFRLSSMVGCVLAVRRARAG